MGIRDLWIGDLGSGICGSGIWDWGLGIGDSPSLGFARDRELYLTFNQSKMTGKFG